jgi:hypothetical protein
LHVVLYVFSSSCLVSGRKGPKGRILYHVRKNIDSCQRVLKV